jgi:hypothetical protein
VFQGHNEEKLIMLKFFAIFFGVFLVPLAIVTADAAPNINHGSVSGSDRVRTKDGASCEQAVATGKSFTAGIYGEDSDRDSRYDYGYSNSYGNDKGVYAGIQIQFGGVERIDCTRMYNNEMHRKDIELDLMRVQHQNEMVLLQQEIERLNSRGTLRFAE